MSEPIGVGLIGYGLGGRAFHAPYIRSTQGMALKAIVSRDPGKVVADLPDTLVVPDVETLLATPGIDLVVVSSPDALHAAHALAALRAGKHVVIDKPFATNLDDARAIAAEADARGLVVTAFQNRRWDADFRTLQRLIADGALGRVVELRSHFDRWRPEPAATWKEAREGGAWLDLGPHLVDQALVLFGRPQAIRADLATLRDDAPAPDYFDVTLRYESHRVLLHSTKLAADHGLRFVVHGTRASWSKRGFDPQEAATVAGRSPAGEDWGTDTELGTLTSGEAGRAPERVTNERGDYRLFWHALAAVIRGEAPNPVPPSDALAVMELLDAGLQSAREGREVLL